MDDLEARLKRLTPRQPSPALDARVLKAIEARSAERGARRQSTSAASDKFFSALRAPRSALRTVSLRWALAAALLMGLLGFLAGRLLPTGGGAGRLTASPANATPAVTVHVVYEGRAANPFDYTEAADDGLRPVPGIQFTPGAQPTPKNL